MDPVLFRLLTAALFAPFPGLDLAVPALDVGAGAEGAAAPGEDDRSHAGGLVKRLDRLSHFAEHGVAEHVEAIRFVERDYAYAVSL
ncbi:hypothetical protein LCGC14_1641470, partial [marine sediment metagenome]